MQGQSNIKVYNQLVITCAAFFQTGNYSAKLDMFFRKRMVLTAGFSVKTIHLLIIVKNQHISPVQNLRIPTAAV